MDIFYQAASILFHWENFAIAIVGIVSGIILGAIPGLGPTMAIVIFLPLTFYMSPIFSMMLLIGIYRGGIYGGSISAILINTPGTPTASATLLDGYPMAKQGKALKALDAALYGSLSGDIFGILLLILCAEPLAKVALKFGPAEYFSLVLLSLTIVASVSGKSILKGLIVAVFGIVLSLVGLDPILGSERFTFGTTTLLEGIPYIPLLMGLFALSEILTLAEKGMTATGDEKTDANINVSEKGDRLTFKEFWSKRMLVLRSGIIGAFFGALPGLGGTAAAFGAYGIAQKTSKHPEKFGTGVVEGVLAPETANNAVCGAALIPTIALGIPGDGTTAVLLGAFVLAGLTPGPLVFTKHAATMYAIFMGLLISGIFLYIFAKIAIRAFALILKVPKSQLFSIVIVLCVIGSYVYGNNIFSVWVMFLGGILGYIMRKYDFPLAPLVIAMILSPILESSLRQALIISSGDISIFFARPISAVFLLFTIISVSYIAFSKYTEYGKVKAQGNKAIDNGE